jgi:hypothetical protein
MQRGERTVIKQKDANGARYWGVRLDALRRTERFRAAPVVRPAFCRQFSVSDSFNTDFPRQC